MSDNITFSPSTSEDLAEEITIVARCFGEESATPLPERIAIQHKNEYTFWSLKASGHVVGYISIYRFPPEFLDDLLAGKRTEHEITIERILPFIKHEPLDVYIDVVAVDPHLSLHLRNLYAGIMASRFIQAMSSLQTENYQIRAFYTITTTREGEKLAQKLGFHRMEGKSVVPNRVAHVLNPEQNRHMALLSQKGVEDFDSRAHS